MQLGEKECPKSVLRGIACSVVEPRCMSDESLVSVPFGIHFRGVEWLHEMASVFCGR